MLDQYRFYKCGYCLAKFDSLGKFRKHHSLEHNPMRDDSFTPTFTFKLQLCNNCVNRINLIKKNNQTVYTSKLIIPICTDCIERNGICAGSSVEEQED